MKLAFSTSACPTWDLATVIEKAKTLGYAGVEIHGLAGQTYLPTVSELAADPAGVRRRFAEAGVELAALASEASFHWPDSRILASHKQRVREYVELAEQLGCPYVTVSAGDVPPKRTPAHVLARVSAVLAELSGFAGKHNVRLAVANSRDLASSRDLWFLLDAVDAPTVRACWDACTALGVRERPTVSIPRLNRKIVLMHVTDGRVSSNGRALEPVLPGEGDIGWQRCIELLRGVGFGGWLVFECPSPCPPAMADPDKTLPAVLEFLKSRVARAAAVEDGKDAA